MPNSAMKASPTVSAHAILSRRRRRHDIILINFAICSHRSLDREGSSLRVKRKAPHPPPGRGAKPRALRIRAAWGNGIGPHVNLDVNSQDGGDTLAPRVCATRTFETTRRSISGGSLWGVLSSAGWWCECQRLCK
jgi:hypothetical protein